MTAIQFGLFIADPEPESAVTEADPEPDAEALRWAAAKKEAAMNRLVAQGVARLMGGPPVEFSWIDGKRYVLRGMADYARWVGRSRHVYDDPGGDAGCGPTASAAAVTMRREETCAV